MKYYKISAFHTKDCFSITCIKRAAGSDRSDIRRCKLLNEAYLDGFEFEVSQKGKVYDFLANDMSWLLVSEVVKLTIQEACSDSEVQFLQLMLPKDLKKMNFFLLNPLKKFDCLDYDKSSLNFETNDLGRRFISAVYKIGLRQDAIEPNARVFRVAGIEPYLFIDQVLRDALIKAGVSGFSFSEIES
jgi:hypothetical protein